MPDTIGPHIDDPYRGWLVFEHLPPDLQREEDSTQAHDFDWAWKNQHWHAATKSWYAERPATDAERTLLRHLGYTLPDELTTRVSYVTETLRRRTWPALETTEGVD